MIKNLTQQKVHKNNTANIIFIAPQIADTYGNMYSNININQPTRLQKQLQDYLQKSHNSNNCTKNSIHYNSGVENNHNQEQCLIQSQYAKYLNNQYGHRYQYQQKQYYEHHGNKQHSPIKQLKMIINNNQFNNQTQNREQQSTQNSQMNVSYNIKQNIINKYKQQPLLINSTNKSNCQRNSNSNSKRPNIGEKVKGKLQSPHKFDNYFNDNQNKLNIISNKLDNYCKQVIQVQPEEIQEKLYQSQHHNYPNYKYPYQQHVNNHYAQLNQNKQQNQLKNKQNNLFDQINTDLNLNTKSSSKNKNKAKQSTQSQSQSNSNRSSAYTYNNISAKTYHSPLSMYSVNSIQQFNIQQDQPQLQENSPIDKLNSLQQSSSFFQRNICTPVISTIKRLNLNEVKLVNTQEHPYNADQHSDKISSHSQLQSQNQQSAYFSEIQIQPIIKLKQVNCIDMTRGIRQTNNNNKDNNFVHQYNVPFASSRVLQCQIVKQQYERCQIQSFCLPCDCENYQFEGVYDATSKNVISNSHINSNKNLNTNVNLNNERDTKMNGKYQSGYQYAKSELQKLKLNVKSLQEATKNLLSCKIRSVQSSVVLPSTINKKQFIFSHKQENNYSKDKHFHIDNNVHTQPQKQQSFIQQLQQNLRQVFQKHNNKQLSQEYQSPNNIKADNSYYNNLQQNKQQQLEKYFTPVLSSLLNNHTGSQSLQKQNKNISLQINNQKHKQYITDKQNNFPNKSTNSKIDMKLNNNINEPTIDPNMIEIVNTNSIIITQAHKKLKVEGERIKQLR